MTKPGRIPCINPRCNRTAAAEKHPDSEEIICYQCWKRTPRELRDRYFQLRKREKQIEKMLRKRGENDPEKHHFRAVWEQMNLNWRSIRAYYCSPDANSPPEGLETFMIVHGIGR